MKISFLGGGNMATALIGGLLNHGFPASALAAALEIDETQAKAIYDDIGNKRRTTRYMHLSPVLVAGVLASVRHLKTDQALRDRQQLNARILKMRLKGLGLPVEIVAAPESPAQ